MYSDYQKNGFGKGEFERRENLQTLFDRSFLDGNKHSLREQYKALRRLELNSPLNFSCKPTSISYIAENITIACDILLTETDTSFVFCGNETQPVLSCPRFTAKALLNLISNAYLYSTERLITVKTVDIGSFVKAEVQSGGHFTSDFRYGKGLSFVNQVCLKSKGNFFIEQSDYHWRAIMIFPKADSLKASDENCDFYELITNRLSPVYIELFGMEYH